ncbi:MAG: DUF262 domain-containing protein [Paludibacteraceae bacterium]|nr:DUF262 domain-containing protein [Paludibacteraceae bacterium]
MENLGKSITEIFDVTNKYIIPLYQRNYAWGKEQIEALIQDIYEAYKKDKNSNYYIGSLVVLRRHNGDYEVIDGQQRLTTLSLLTKILGITNAPVLYYESRPEVEEFFAEFYESTDATYKTMKPQTHYLREAVEYIKEAKVLEDGAEMPFKNLWGEVKKYLENNVILVKTEIPEDTDVATYFEIMNNRGEQLQKHEILKARLMNALNPKYHDEFNLIWTACSTMDRHIQQCFNADDREKYFGDKYNEFVFSELSGSSEEVTDGGGCTINDILKGGGNLPSSSDNNSENDFNSVNSIIDFPNFLMHIMKLYAKGRVDIRLNEKYMLEDAERLFKDGISEAVAKDFLALLFKTRTLFDRYVVKIKPGTSDDDFDWVMNRPQRYVYNNKSSVKYDLHTFGDELQKQLIKAQSMLQVTYRQRIYKNWLQGILSYLKEQKCDLSEIDGNGILNHLHKYMASQYEALEFDSISKAGVNTPHFLLNFIDYLYWLKKDGIKDFHFRYWNSVEHHLAKNYAKGIGVSEETIDCIGNLFLISKSANSRLNDRSVSEKIERFKEGNMGANRQIIYQITKIKGWGKTEIEKHYDKLVELLGDYQTILKLNDQLHIRHSAL